MSDQPGAGPGHRTVISIGSVITIAFAGSVLVTPLYPLYQQRFGFSEIILTLIYAVYVVGNVVALLLFGQVSDQIGRRRAAVPGLALAGVGAVVFIFSAGPVGLASGRLLIGLAVGIASGTGTAWLAEVSGPDRRTTATLAAAVANLSGIALGPLVGGLLAQYAPHPLLLPFLIYLAALAAVVVAVATTADTGRPAIRRLAELRVRPRVGVPRELVRPFLAPATTGFVIFGLGGLYFALIPGLLRRDLHVSNVAIGGVIVFELGLVAVIITVLARRLSPALSVRAGLLIIVPAAALVVIAQVARSLPVLLVAAALAGAALALGYRGSLQTVNEMAPANRRAELVSSYYIACFAGNSVPVIGIGVLSALTRPLVGTIVFAVVIAALALAALLSRGDEPGRRAALPRPGPSRGSGA